MFDLNKSEDYKRFDSKGMGPAIAGMPEDIKKGVEKARAFTIPADYRNVERIVITGMGGSAMAGELLRILASSEAGIPLIVTRDYMVPAFVDEKTLVIASSFSGGTAETISSMLDAAEKKAKIIAFSRGGKIAEEADKLDVPAFYIDYDGLPRAALGFTLSALVCFMEDLGFISGKTADFDNTVKIMKEWRSEIEVAVAEEKNEAKQLARKMLGKAIAIYGGDTLYGAARRWKQQINENSKHMAFSGDIPEMNHNMLLGLEFPVDSVKNLMWIFLASKFDHEKNKRRIQATKVAGEKAGVDGVIIEGRGESILAQTLSTILFGDYVSYYLGMLHETDPSDLSAVRVFKEKMQST